jgi:hypothetical protein
MSQNNRNVNSKINTEKTSINNENYNSGKEIMSLMFRLQIFMIQVVMKKLH